jgi:co-chaperonin GroES (HSP10)
MPQSQEMRANVGEVIAVGDKCEVLKVGDVVTFGKYAPMKLDIKELEYYGIECEQQNADDEILLMNEEDILCVVLKDEPEAA